MDKFKTFLDPVFRYIDGGRLFKQPFQVLYYLIGIVTALSCLAFIVWIFDYVSYLSGVGYLFAILMLFVLLAAGVLSLLFWFKRATQVNADVPENSRFLAIPAVGGFIINWGEWLGLVGAFVSFCFGVLMLVIFPIAGGGSESFVTGLLVAILGPIGSYIALIFYRLLGEMILALGNIANDVRKISKKEEKVEY